MSLVGLMVIKSGYCPRLKWPRNDEALHQASRQYLPVLLSSIVASGGLLVDQAMAAMLPSGSVSSLVFANRFVSVVVTLMAGAIASAITPYISEMIARREWQQCRETLRVWALRMASISVPVALALIASAQPLVRLTLQHGSFGPSDTAIVKS